MDSFSFIFVLQRFLHIHPEQYRVVPWPPTSRHFLFFLQATCQLGSWQLKPVSAYSGTFTRYRKRTSRTALLGHGVLWGYWFVLRGTGAGDGTGQQNGYEVLSFGTVCCIIFQQNTWCSGGPSVSGSAINSGPEARKYERPTYLVVFSHPAVNHFRLAGPLANRVYSRNPSPKRVVSPS